MIRIENQQAFIDTNEVPLKRFQCHKKVWAFKIGAVKQLEDPKNAGSGVYHWWIVPEDAAWPKFKVDTEWALKHKPEAGGYFVIYDDGYCSFSPEKAFVDGYSQI
jgi:hypothetical protein